MPPRSSHSPDTSPASPRRVSARSASPATVAVLIFALLAMLRLLVFRPESLIAPTVRPVVTVRYVIDGDTLDLDDGRRVRLLGIDAPEAGFQNKAAEPWAEESTAWLRDQAEGRDVQLRIDSREKDRYGRTLAWIFHADGTLINQESLLQGHAKLLADFGLPADLEPALREAESEARIQKRGLWGNGRRKQ